MTTLEPLGETLPSLNASMAQMNKTAQDMAPTLRKLPKQGMLGVGLLVDAELLGDH